MTPYTLTPAMIQLNPSNSPAKREHYEGLAEREHYEGLAENIMIRVNLRRFC
jgi:hypothetical protein